MKIIPTRVFTCKVCPATRVCIVIGNGRQSCLSFAVCDANDSVCVPYILQIKFCSEPNRFILDDGYQPPATLESPNREILGATFYKHVLKNIGKVVASVYYIPSAYI